ncbi:unnamed protein product, partial [Iphiclides podalirius]
MISLGRLLSASVLLDQTTWFIAGCYRPSEFFTTSPHKHGYELALSRLMQFKSRPQRIAALTVCIGPNLPNDEFFDHPENGRSTRG